MQYSKSAEFEYAVIECAELKCAVFDCAEFPSSTYGNGNAAIVKQSKISKNFQHLWARKMLLFSKISKNF